MPFALNNPAGLFLLGGLVPLAILYLLRVRRERRVVSSLFLFRAAEHDVLAERKLRRVLPEAAFFFEAAAIVLLALALAGPTVRRSLLGDRDERVALVVDTSASMSALEGGPTGQVPRFDAARRAAKEMLRSLGAGATTILVESARTPRAVTGFEQDPRRLEAALDALAPREEEGDLPAAVALALDRVGRTPKSRVVVVTDANGDAPAENAQIDVVRVGAPIDNAAILRLEVRRAVDRSTGLERADAFAAIANYGVAKATRFVTLKRRDDPRPVASRRIELTPGERASVVLSFEPLPGDTGTGLVAELSPGDALPSDDRAFRLIPPGPRLKVLLSPGDPWLRRAFAADPEVELVEAAEGAPPPPRDALVVTVGSCPASPPAGDLLVVAPPKGPCLGVRVGDSIRSPVISSWSEHDPRLRFVSFDDVHVTEAPRVDAPRGASLVNAGDSALIADLGLPGRSGTLVAFDLGHSNWPLRASFVLFARNVAELARANRNRAVGVPQRTGEMLRVPVPGAAADGSVLVRGPGGSLHARVVEGVAVAGAPSVAGFYDVTGARGPLGIPEQAGPLATVAVDLASERESDLRHVPTTTATTSGREATTKQRPPPLVSWPFAFAAMLVLLGEALFLSRLPHRRAAPSSLPARLVAGVPLLFAVFCAAYAFLGARRIVESPFLEFARPGFTIAGVAAVAVVGLRVRRFPLRTGAVRRVLVELSLATAVLAAALAAAEPSLGFSRSRMVVIVAEDRSRSMDLVPGSGETIRRALSQAAIGMHPEDRLGVVAFASEAALEEPLRGREEPAAPQHAPLSRDGTDLAAAIRRALAEAPADAALRVVLASDGVATRGDTTESALAAVLAGVPIDVFPLEQGRRESVRVDSVRAPPHADKDEAFDLRVTTRASRDTDVDVSVLRDGVVVRKGRKTIHQGEDALFIREKADEPGLHRYDVHVAPVDPRADAVPEDNDAATFVRVQGPSKALVLENEPARAAALKSALESAGFAVDVAGATHAPGDIEELSRQDLLVLGNVPAADLSTALVGDVASYVQHLGGGLLLVGGDRAMGPGGYARTPIEDVSPVSFELRNERRKARLAQVIVIDYSGSMSAVVGGGRTKLALANEAAARSAELLAPGDRLAVAHVDTEVAWTVPLAPLGDKVETLRRIRNVSPGGGGILVDRALEAAYAALGPEKVELRHVLLFSDGDDAEDRDHAPELARQALAKGITTSVVSLGRGQDATALERLSRTGQGRFYLIEDASRLPAVFAQETTIAAGNAIQEVAFRPTLRVPTSALRGVDVAGAPALAGYVVTTAKPRAEVALGAPDGDPLLASWPVGIGRAAAFTSDYGGAWGATWAAWPDGARIFAQLGRDLSRRGDDPRVSLESAITGDTLSIRALARDEEGAGDAFRHLRATVAGPDGFARTRSLSPTGPGTYAADVPLGHAGSYVVSLLDETRNAVVGTTGAILSAGQELEPTGTDHAELERIARLTGGKVRHDLAGVFDDRPARRRSYVPLLPALLLGSAIGLLGAASARKLSPPGGRRRSRWHGPRRAPAAKPEGEPVTPAPDSQRLAPRSPEGGDTREPPGGGPRTTGGVPPPEPMTTAEVLLRRKKKRE